MNKRVVFLTLILCSFFVTHGYTIRIYYSGSNDTEVVAPDSITISSTINGGSACWGNNFSVTINNGTYQDVIIDTSNAASGIWNCHFVPEMVNGESLVSSLGYWPLFNLDGMSTDGETWTIQKIAPVTYTYPMYNPMGDQQTISYTIQWNAAVQKGIN